jgi:tetratricopeptide (TPR) repeat protein
MASPKRTRNIILGVLVVIVLGCLIVAVSPLREKITWRIDQLITRIFYTVKAPEQAVFVPNTPDATVTPQVLPTSTATLPPTSTQTLPPEVDTPTPEPTSTPLPDEMSISGVAYVDQHGLFNYCAPANLAMALSYWGWDGKRTDIGTAVKPNPEDFNVMPYEMVDYVNQQTDYYAIMRYGGTHEIVKELVANGFPVLLEAGRYMVDLTGKLSWMGHYTLVTGYSDITQEFITQDSYFTADYPVTYEELEKWWRPFNFVFMVVYEPEQEQRLLDLLGDYRSEEQSSRIAYDIATQEIWALEGVDRYFAWFNRGSSMINLGDYYGAAESFDEANLAYTALPESERPWRMMWYQTGPYFAYYLTGRYQDVIGLADFTLDNARLKILEETYVWRGRAYAALGDMEKAQEDFCASLKYHEGFEPALLEIQRLGLSDCP